MNVDKLKARINKIASETGTSHQHLYDMYFFDGILNRMRSNNCNNVFIIWFTIF